MSISKLALFGGKPIVQEHSTLVGRWPTVTKKDLEDVVSALEDHDFSGRNSFSVDVFERKLQQFLGIEYVSLFNSGTSALHGALTAVGVQPGDEVIVPAYTFLAPAMAALHLGAIPVFCDIDESTFNIQPEKIPDLITRKTKAIVVVHMHGLPADIPAIKKIAEVHGIKVIEDCAQSFGAMIGDKYCGTLGDISAFSFMSAKQLATCGELGGIATNDIDFRNRANLLKTYGEILGKHERVYNSYTLGYNYVANPIQARFAQNKLESFNEDINPLLENARALSEFILKKIPFLIPPYVPQSFKHVYHFFRVRVNGEVIGYKKNHLLRQAIMDIMKAEGLNLRFYQNTPVPGQTIFQTLNANMNGYPWHMHADKNERYKANYKIENYPNTLKTISESFVVGGSGAAPLYFTNKETIEYYMAGFDKISQNIGEVISYANSLQNNYIDPWIGISKISDTKGDFKIFT